MKKNILAIAFIGLLAACNNNPQSEETTTVSATPNIAYTIVNTYPHDTSSFTEGFEYHDGFLYESTGDSDYKGKSKLAKTELVTGKDVQKINLAADYFGEGLTLLNGKIYQLTYKEKKCFVYDAKTFQKINEFTYEGQGWGMTNDGTNLIMDNGTNNLIYRNPNNFAIVKTVAVTGVPNSSDGASVLINELEYVDGFVYANTWTQDYDKIVKIEPTNGSVVGQLDFNGVLSSYAKPTETIRRDVFNGIAYNSDKKIFYLTGKNWPKIFEVKLN